MTVGWWLLKRAATANINIRQNRGGLRLPVIRRMTLLPARSTASFGKPDLKTKTMSTKFLIVIEKTPNNLSAFSPDLPGCVATGATQLEVEERMRDAIRMHLDGMREDGVAIPEPLSVAEYIDA